MSLYRLITALNAANLAVLLITQVSVYTAAVKQPNISNVMWIHNQGGCSFVGLSEQCGHFLSGLILTISDGHNTDSALL